MVPHRRAVVDAAIAALLILPGLGAISVWFAKPPSLPEPAVSTGGLVADPAD
jgi:hypothetical protein